MSAIREDRLGSLRRVTLEAGGLAVSVLPELGGKLTAIRRLASGRNALLEPPEREPRLAAHGDAFDAHDTSGFDDCFPTVGRCESPDEPGLILPDHGDLWSVPWELDRADDGLVLSVAARSVPCRLTRRLTIEGETLRLDYELVSQADRPLALMWSAHPLFAASPGSRLHLPREVDSLLLEWSAGDRLGHHGDRVPWPRAGERDLSTLGPRDLGTADKLFTDRITGTGGVAACALHDRASDESVTIRFDPEKLPYLGLWICQGGWPVGRPPGHYTVALEPAHGRTDALQDAARAGECLQLAARGQARWSLTIELRAGAPAGFAPSPA